MGELGGVVNKGAKEEGWMEGGTAGAGGTGIVLGKQCLCWSCRKRS